MDPDLVNLFERGQEAIVVESGIEGFLTVGTFLNSKSLRCRSKESLNRGGLEAITWCIDQVLVPHIVSYLVATGRELIVLSHSIRDIVGDEGLSPEVDLVLQSLLGKGGDEHCLTSRNFHSEDFVGLHSWVLNEVSEESQVVKTWHVVHHRLESQLVAVLRNDVSGLRYRLVSQDRVLDGTTKVVSVFEAVSVGIESNNPIPATEGHSLEEIN